MPSGTLTLELNFIAPQKPVEAGKKIAILLHPWSRLGGRMTDHVLEGLSGFLHDLGYYVVVFNSRGVGKSSGWPSFTGLQEVEDLKEVMQWSLARIPDAQEVLLVGYSHGSLVASLHPPLPSPIKTSHILLSYPLSVRGWITLFHGNTYASGLSDLLSDPSSKVLVIYGDEDQFTGVGAYEKWVDELKAIAPKTGRLGKFEALFVQGADHFWHPQRAAEMYRGVERWLAS